MKRLHYVWIIRLLLVLSAVVAVFLGKRDEASWLGLAAFFAFTWIADD